MQSFEIRFVHAMLPKCSRKVIPLMIFSVHPVEKSSELDNFDNWMIYQPEHSVQII